MGRGNGKMGRDGSDAMSFPAMFIYFLELWLLRGPFRVDFGHLNSLKTRIDPTKLFFFTGLCACVMVLPVRDNALSVVWYVLTMRIPASALHWVWGVSYSILWTLTAPIHIRSMGKVIKIYMRVYLQSPFYYINFLL